MHAVWSPERGGVHPGRVKEGEEKMEVRGTPGGEAWIKAKVQVIQITEAGTTYYVKVDGSGQAFEIKEGDILFDTDAAAMLAETSSRLEEIKEDLERDPLEDIGSGDYRIPEAEPKRGRGRPRKATVEGLMAKAEQARIKRNEGGDLWDS